ncbi:hypothetical protein [Acetobacter conturbans]|uniref:Uncharacterized protein n=1 Tax=Acetobacter conturbans TaxID=1737472 RepID=A0ABX0JYF8_9PROT|nr:hypothetical protein [Acetobacter conturbans]NHN88361.1 hypothetical protein [Acetobacter conturbans]
MTDSSTATSASMPAYTLTGPVSLSVGSKATYTIAPASDTILTAALTITPTSTLAGTFTPASVTLAAGATTAVTFIFVPSVAGSGTISTTNSASLTDPASLSVVAIAIPTTFTTYTIAGSTTLIAGVPATYTLTPGSGTALSTDVTLTPACTLGGTFSPASVTIPAGSTTAVTFTFTVSGGGVGTLSISSGGALTNPADLFITASASENPFSEYALTGPRSLIAGTAATYTLTPGTGAGNSSAITVTPSCTLSGTFFPQTSTFPAGSTQPLTFTFTPALTGTGTLSVVNTGTLTNPPSFTITALTVTTPYTLAVDSAAFLFSPGNWSGDEGRDGSAWRSTWNVGAWFQVAWLASSTPTATLHLGPENTGAYITYFLNNVVTSTLSAQTDLTLSDIVPGQINTLEVFLTRTPTTSRWNKGTNCLTVSGMTVDAASSAGYVVTARPWGKLVGDDTTEGTMADNGTDNVLSSYSYLLLRAMEVAGYATGVSACAGSGYITPGDTTQDVPAFYSVSGSSNGAGGLYDDTKSRWNLIDSGISALDSDSMLSAYGDGSTQPAWIAFNLLAQDALAYASQSDAQAAMTQSLLAHREAAPDAWLFAVMPFGFHYATTYSATWPQIFNNAVSAYKSANPDDDQFVVIDVGTRLSVLLESNRGWYTSTDGHQLLEPGHAIFAATVATLMLGSMTTQTTRTYLYY